MIEIMNSNDELKIERVKNGATVYLRNVNNIDGKIYTGIVVGSGSLNETTSGTAHILEHMLINGSFTNQQGDRFSRRRATTDFYTTIFLTEISSCDMLIFIQFLKKIFCKDKLDYHDFIVAQEDVWNEYTEVVDTTQHRILQGLFSNTQYFEKLPLGNKDIKKVTFEEISEYYQKFYQIKNSAIILCGNLSNEINNYIMRVIQSIESKPYNVRNPSIIGEKILYDINQNNIYNSSKKGIYYFVIDEILSGSKLEYCYKKILEDYAIYVLEKYLYQLFPHSVEICCNKEHFNRKHSFLVICFSGLLKDFDIMISVKQQYNHKILHEIIIDSFNKYKKEILCEKRYGIKLEKSRTECIQNFIFGNQIVLFDEYNTFTSKALECFESEDIIKLLNCWFFENNNFRKIY